MRDLTEIINWRRLDPRTTLSGQPTEAQLAQISELGVTHIINLGPHTNKGALEDEAGTVAELGMSYIYIPVDFENPTDEDFQTFCDAIERVANTQIHVHCIYNARVSAFFYRFAQSGKGFTEAETFELMDGIWRPGGVWAEFIDNKEALNLPNRYSGYDY